MDKVSLNSIRDFILEKNPYFATGYADAFVMPEDGRVMIYDGTGFKPIFPNDNVGDYFYMRSDDGVSFSVQDAQRISDYGATRYVSLDTATYHLVAVVKDADRYMLVNNLRNTLAMYSGMYLIPTSALWVAEAVVVNELSGIPEADLQNVMQRLGKHTIVRITLTMSRTYVSNECINDICKTC